MSQTANNIWENKVKAEVILDTDYRPAEDETFMNDRQAEYFRRKLNAWKTDLMSDSKETIEGMQEGARNIPDVADRASEETDRALELRTRDRARKLVAKIESALRRIEDGSYGYCEDTGEPISLKRLDARPIATLSLEAQERHERKERVHRDDWVANASIKPIFESQIPIAWTLVSFYLMQANFLLKLGLSCE